MEARLNLRKAPRVTRMQTEGDGINKALLLFFEIVGIASFGGAVHELNRPRKSFSWWGLMRRVVTAAFVGCLAHWTMSYYDVHEKIQFAVVGGCGYAAVDLLEAFGPAVIDYCRKRMGLPPRGGQCNLDVDQNQEREAPL